MINCIPLSIKHGIKLSVGLTKVISIIRLKQPLFLQVMAFHSHIIFHPSSYKYALMK
jgi:hypothetical protein